MTTHATPATDMGDLTQANSLEDARLEAGSPTTSSNKEKNGSSEPKDGAGEEQLTEDYRFADDRERKGAEKMHKLSWQRLTVCLIVEAIALGSLSMPSVFATLGMVPAVITTVGIGFVAIYTSYIVGLTCLKYPEVTHYDQIGYLFFGKIGKQIFGVIFVVYLSFVTASHVLTGTELWNALSTTQVCSLAFGVISAIILYLVALPPTFHDMAILGYVDFASICLAILITMIGTGIAGQREPGGLANADWHAFPTEPVSFKKAFVAITNIVFAYSFAACQPSFMSEMHRPKDFVKSIWTLGLIEIFIYTVTGAVIYRFVGSDVKSPALLSAGGNYEKAAWGVAIPVVFISGSINSQVAGRYAHQRIFKGTKHEYINTVKGWGWWLGIIAAITIFAWIVAEAIPFFSDMLSIISSLFISGYSFFWPGFMWWILLRNKGSSIFKSKTDLFHAFASTLSIIIGFTVVVAGLYSSIVDIRDEYATGSVKSPFTCGSTSG